MKSITLMSKKKINTPPPSSPHWLQILLLKKKNHFNFFDCIFEKLEIVINLHRKQILKSLLDLQRAMEINHFIFEKKKKIKKQTS